MAGLLDGRVVLVTGGGRGIGRSHCLELAAHGAVVVVNDLGVGLTGERDGESPAEKVAAEIQERGGRAMADGTSVTDWTGIAALVDRVVAEFGHLDGVVNNAGIVRDRMITSLSEEDFDAVVAVHLKGSFTVLKHACDHWRRVAKAGGHPAGRIVNTTSGTGLRGNPGQVPYGVAKAGIANLTLTAAMEMARYGVTVNAISPVAFTRMYATVPSMAGRVAPEGVWDPLDPANSSPLVAWLLSQDSGWLTGQVLRVEGGTVWRQRPWEADPVPLRAASGHRLDAAEVGPGLRRLYGVAPAGLEQLS